MICHIHNVILQLAKNSQSLMKLISSVVYMRDLCYRWYYNNTILKYKILLKSYGDYIIYVSIQGASWIYVIFCHGMGNFHITNKNIRHEVDLLKKDLVELYQTFRGSELFHVD